MPESKRRGIAGAVLLLAPGQLISWGTLYYAIAFLVGPIQRDTGWRQQAIFLAFSAGLLVAAVAAAPVGRLLSKHGGRSIMVTGSALAAMALVMIATSHSPMTFAAGWLLAGLAMALSQYEAAFATLRQLAPEDFRRAVGWLTVVGGFASTAFWPLTHWLAEALGWRQTVMIFAALHLVCLPLHFRLPHGDRDYESVSRVTGAQGPADRPVLTITFLLALAFTAAAIVTATISAHAGRLLESTTIATGVGLAFLALIGPMQVFGRLLDLALVNKMTAAATGLTTFAMLISALVLLHYAQYLPWALLGFAVAYGMANGIMTVVRGTAPAELNPAADYAAGLGVISTPALVARALAPAAAAWLIETSGPRWVVAALIITAALGGLAFFAAVAVRRREAVDRVRAVFAKSSS